MRQNLGFVLKKQDRENHDPNSIVDYYEVSLAMSLIDVVLSELKRRFEGSQTLLSVVCISLRI